jgi:type I restriction enzyme S subunit
MSMTPQGRLKMVNRNWIGRIPNEWDAAMIKSVARLESGHTPSRSVPAYWENCTIPWFSLADVWQLREANRKYVHETSELVSELGVANSSARILPPGTVILSRTASVGFSGIMGCEMATTQDFVNWVCGDRLKPDYLWYCLQAMTPEFDRLRFGSTHQTIYMPDVAQFKIPLPRVSEQERIANFLDAQTARVDALITEKTRLLLTLREFEEAEITCAVTRGLRADSPLTRANAPWLGNVPSHWIETRVRRVCHRVTDGAHISPDLSSPDFPFVSTVDVVGGVINFDNCLRVSSECYDYLVRNGCQPSAGDVLFSKDGTIGRTAIVPDSVPGFVVASSLIIMSPKHEEVLSGFLDYWLNNTLIKQNTELQLSGAALRRISVEKVGRLSILLPPIAEQIAIVERLDALTSRVRLLRAHALEHIERLREYRSSLISAAVTGQLDIGVYPAHKRNNQINRGKHCNQMS